MAKMKIEVSVKDVEPMKNLVNVAFDICCFREANKPIPEHKFFELRVALGRMGVNEETYVNPLLLEGDNLET